MEKSIVFIDLEIGQDNKICDIGAVRGDGAILHTKAVKELREFVAGSKYVCGHNIIRHDLLYLNDFFDDDIMPIDTLLLSPLLFPQKPYHSLVKNDKIVSDDLNNPVNDCKQARTLFYDEINAFNSLDSNLKTIYFGLLGKTKDFNGFFKYLGFNGICVNLEKLIRHEFEGLICANSDVQNYIKMHPIDLAYALALIGTKDPYSISPGWINYEFSMIENILHYLTNKPCNKGCPYCNDKLDIHKALSRIFGFDSFRIYDGEPLQEKAVKAAVEGKSLLAVFPTGGGKSLTFQLPALIAGENSRGLTVVISPLQSLMKDQVDNLINKGITSVATINGLLNPIERANAIERVYNGNAKILYISPEQLRSRTIEKMLLSRNVVRFVIDEAHCFSAWGQDFRVDYLYIGDFIKQLQEKKSNNKTIAVSCFTATAKQKVIADICDYFESKLGLKLEIFATTSTRKNLHYRVLFKESEGDKFNTLRELIIQKNCPTIVYVSRTKDAENLAKKLTASGINALPYHGKMETNDRIKNQDMFINNEVQVIVATSAFGMGVDKKDVRLVVHFDISGSLENYVQEAGRAGRDPNLQAECYVLYNDNDLDKHFVLINQTKLTMSEIQQVWQAIKRMTKHKPYICCSALELARHAGWDEEDYPVETRVKAAISALENAGYVKRGYNSPRCYANSILARNMAEASSRIDKSSLFDEKGKQIAKRIMSFLISRKKSADAGNREAESRVDYIADRLGLAKEVIIDSINIMRLEGILADEQDMSALILDSKQKSSRILEEFFELELFLLAQLETEGRAINLKKVNDKAHDRGVTHSNVKKIRKILDFLSLKNYIEKQEHMKTSYVEVKFNEEISKMNMSFHIRIDICRFIVDELYSMLEQGKLVHFSLVSLFNSYREIASLDVNKKKISLDQVKEALFYLEIIGAIKLEGGFLVHYQGMEIERLARGGKVRYKKEDYRMLDRFYEQKIQQVHIVGEYANLMVRDYDAALRYVQDYFQMDFNKFIDKYFKGEKKKALDYNMTPKRYKKIFGQLSEKQKEILNDKDSKYIVVAAGPGSGKTRVLVHKLASLLILEDVKHEQLLMLTFSRAAATEFKKRLADLIGDAAYYVDIKTFHSFCFDLLGRTGNLDESDEVVKKAVKMIRNGEAELGKITRTVLVIDEAQDMDKDEYSLIRELIKYNEDMRVVAVGDDDQNIYEFRGSSSEYFKSLLTEYDAGRYEMNENFRSKANIVALTNAFAETMKNRLKKDPIVPVQKENGIVRIINHTSMNIEEAVVNNFVKEYKGGTACIMTNTNEEALRILWHLDRHNIQAKLIQSNDGFKMYNLVEVRYFLTQIDKELSSPVISDELWNKNKEKTLKKYARSSCINIIKNFFGEFEKVNKEKYRSDLEEFCRESNYEDFYDENDDKIYVSTIHKSKGREFDEVYIMLSNIYPSDDEQKRKLYVGITRAKEALYIHCNTNIFKNCSLPGVEIVYDNFEYGETEEIILQLTHRDVNLGFTKLKNKVLFNIMSGDLLSLDNGYLTAEFNGRTHKVVMFSKKFKKTLNEYFEKGYVFDRAEARFLVSWRDKEDNKEYPLVLPNIYMKKVEAIEKISTF